MAGSSSVVSDVNSRVPASREHCGGTVVGNRRNDFKNGNDDTAGAPI